MDTTRMVTLKAEIDEDEDGKTDVIAYDYNEDGE